MSIRKNGTAAAVRLLSAGAGFVVSAYLARVLGAEAFGKFGGSIAYLNIAIVIGLLGYENVAAKLAALDECGAAIRRAIALSIWISASVAIALIWTFRQKFGPTGVEFFNIILLAAPIIAWTRLEQAIIRGVGQGEIAGLADGVVRPIATIMLVFAAIHIAPVDKHLAISASWVIASGTGLLFAFQMRKNATNSLQTGIALNPGSLWKSFDAHNYVGTLLSVAFNQLPVIALSLFSTANSVAVYVVSERLAALASMLPQAIHQAGTPRLAKLISDPCRDHFQQEFRSVRRSGLLVGIPVCLVVFFAPGEFLRIFGVGFSSDSAALRMLILVAAIPALIGPVGLALVMIGQSRKNTIAMAWALGILMLSLAALVPKFGAPGAAISLAIATLVWTSLLLLFLREVQSSRDCGVGP